MSRRRGRARAALVVTSEDEEEQEKEEDGVEAAPVAARRPSRGRVALPLQSSQSQGQHQEQGQEQGQGTAAGAAAGGGPGNALAALLAGSRASDRAAGSGAASKPASHSSSRAGGAVGRASANGSQAAAPGAKVGRSSRLATQLTMASSNAASNENRGGQRQQAASQLPAAPSIVPAAAGGGAAAAADLWVHKYAPKGEAQLVIHKKKVQEVREWLEQQRASLGQPGVPRLLVVTGPPGCGKSTILSVLAAAVGFHVSEWRPPPAVQREEAVYAGMQHRSKLDEFGEFVVRSKMPSLTLTSRSSASADAAATASQTASKGDPTQQQQSQQAQQAAGQVRQGGRPGRLPPSLQPTLVIVDDLPHAAGPEQRRQIAEALADLAAGARFPVAVVATETSGKSQQERGLSAAAGSYRGLHKEVLAVLEAQRATTISLNPFTPTNTAKALRSVLAAEKRALPEADVLAIAEQAGGDLHYAISTLQFVCTGAQPSAGPPAKPRRKGTKRKAAAGAGAGAGGGAGDGAGDAEGRPSQLAYALRDSTLSLFHALGKLLYNKRVGGGGDGGSQLAADSGPPLASQQPSSGSLPPPSQQHQHKKQHRAGGGDGSGGKPAGWTANGFWQQASCAGGSGGGSSSNGSGQQELPAAAPSWTLADWAQRLPMENDPEAVLAAAGLEAGSVTAFLHENLPHFIEDGAIRDAASCLDYLSLSDCMAAGRRWGSGDADMADDDMPSSTLLDAAAASTAARGVCFANCHPAPRRWLPLKAPAVFAVQKGVLANRAELSRQTSAAWVLHGGARSLRPSGQMAAELLPYARTMAARCPAPALQRLQPANWARFWGGQLYDHQQQQHGGGGGGGGRQQQWGQQEELENGEGEGFSAQGGGLDPEQDLAAQQQGMDVIEESSEEDDW